MIPDLFDCAMLGPPLFCKEKKFCRPTKFRPPAPILDDVSGIRGAADDRPSGSGLSDYRTLCVDRKRVETGFKSKCKK
jgi:hypothetical protein